MVHVLASISVKADKMDQFLEIFKANVPNVRAEEGCIYYAPCMDTKTDISVQELDGSVVTVIEQWESVDHLNAHLAAPHMLEYGKKTKEMILNLSLKILEEK